MRQLQAYESRSVGGIPPYNVSVNNQKQFNLSPARKNDDLLLLENQIADLNRFQSKLKSFEESKHNNKSNLLETIGGGAGSLQNIVFVV